MLKAGSRNALFPIKYKRGSFRVKTAFFILMLCIYVNLRKSKTISLTATGVQP